LVGLGEHRDVPGQPGDGLGAGGGEELRHHRTLIAVVGADLVLWVRGDVDSGEVHGQAVVRVCATAIE
jgi:hypothetical protein